MAAPCPTMAPSMTTSSRASLEAREPARPGNAPPESGLGAGARVADHKGTCNGEEAENEHQRIRSSGLEFQRPVGETGQDSHVGVAVEHGIEEAAEGAGHVLEARQVSVRAVDYGRDLGCNASPDVVAGKEQP